MREEVVTLREAYERAKSALDKVEYINYYPKYPEEISTFFNLCMRPPWQAKSYDPGETTDLIQRAEGLSLEEIQRVLLAANRSERFGDGSYIGILRDDKLAAIITRLEVLFSN